MTKTYIPIKRMDGSVAIAEDTLSTTRTHEVSYSFQDACDVVAWLNDRATGYKYTWARMLQLPTMADIP